MIVTTQTTYNTDLSGARHTMLTGPVTVPSLILTLKTLLSDFQELGGLCSKILMEFLAQRCIKPLMNENRNMFERKCVMSWV